MVEWRVLCLTFGIIALCFIGIPIKIDNLKSLDKRMIFNSYLGKFNKSYNISTNEYEDHYKNFEEALVQFEDLNKFRNSNELAYYGFTKFADLSKDEFKSKYLRHHGHHLRTNKLHSMQSGRNNEIINGRPLLKTTSKNGGQGVPKIVDWRSHGIVSQIKNQGSCGACWAFSTISNAESMSALKSGKLQELSVQEVIDCAGNGNLGCNGGDTCSLLEWLVENHIKIQTEKQYPLVLHNDVCKLNKSLDYGVQIRDNIFCGNFNNQEDQMLNLIANHGPITVAVNAITWQYYLGGIIRFHCDSTTLNHAVVIVGYDLTGKIPYYIVRNSWGKDFGENGYMKIAIGENVCGISSEVAIFDVL